MTDAVMAVWGDVDPAVEAEFNEWYHREHVPERVGMPGWKSGRRYRRVDRGRHQYLAVYDVASLDSFDEPVYRHALDHPTEWTRRMMPGFRNFVRATCRIRFASGEVAGGVICTVRYAPPQHGREPIARWLAGDALHGLREWPGVTRVRLLEADLGRSLTPTAEQKMRSGRDGEAPFVATLEGTDPDAVEAALLEGGIAAGLAARGAADIEIGVYQLLFALDR